MPRFNHPPIERFEFATENPKGTTAQIDLWIDVAYQGSTLTPIASYATSGKADVLASNAPLSSDASSWGGSTTAFKTSVTITPQMKGYIYVTPKMAKASTTLYYDPKLSVV